MPKTVTESLGLYQDRLHPEGTPSGTDGWWEVTDECSAGAAVKDMLRQLEDHGWPLLTGLLEPGAMLEQVRSGNLGHTKLPHVPGFFAMAEALLLMDDGPSAGLEKALEVALATSTPHQQETAKIFDRWVREQATIARSRT